MFKHVVLALAIGALAVGCESDDPEDTPAGGSGGSGGAMGGSGGEGGTPMGGEPVGGEPVGGEGGMGGEPVGGEPMGGEPVGGEPMGGMGGEFSQECIDACTVLADCSQGSDACPGIVDAGGRDAFYEGCLPACEGNPALRALVNGDDCDGTITTLRGLNPDYDAACTAEEPVECMPGEDYYPGEGWEACISDDGEYHPFRPDNISTLARVASFETIADLLWRMGGDPSSENFIDAQIEYGIDEGLGSRVIRRYDSRIDRPQEDVNCRGEDHGELYPDYCVGPGQILPVLNAAFDAGIAGTEPRVNARRVEAALVWFFHVSTFKEANTCASASKDCDSSWAYYAGGAQPGDEMPTGFGGVVNSIDPAAHQAVMAAILAVRCWRDLDDAEQAENLELAAQAWTQLEAALDRALAVVLIDALERYAAGGDAAAEWWGYLEVLGPTVDLGARKRDAGAADRLMAYFASAGEGDTAGAIADLEILFPCP